MIDDVLLYDTVRSLYSPREIAYMRLIILLIMFCNILAIIASVLRS